jgi:hypothetical protein
MKKGVAELERIVAGGKVAEEERPPIDGDKELPLLMKRMQRAFKRLKAAGDKTKLTGTQQQAVIDEATLISAIANSIQTIDAFAGDDEWTTGAMQLQLASSAIRDAKTFKQQVVVVGRSCSACHESYR